MQNRKKDTDVQHRLLDSVGEGECGMFLENGIKTCILSRVTQIASPGWMHERSAWAWCTRKTQRDRVEREVGGRGSGWGIHVNPWLIHVNVWQKPLQYCKIISLQPINKWLKKKKKKTSGLPFPSPGDLFDPGIKPGSPMLQADSLLFELQGRPLWLYNIHFLINYVTLK